MKVSIYKPTKSVMQSGKAKTKKWLLKYDVENSRDIDPIIGWRGSADTKQQLKLFFPDRESAVSYAEKHGLEYQVIEPKEKRPVFRSYAENFS